LWWTATAKRSSINDILTGLREPSIQKRCYAGLWRKCALAFAFERNQGKNNSMGATETSKVNPKNPNRFPHSIETKFKLGSEMRLSSSGLQKRDQQPKQIPRANQRKARFKLPPSNFALQPGFLNK